MPTYEYLCEKCGHQFTVVQSIGEHEKNPPRCPACQGDKLEPVFSSVNVKTSRKS